MNENPDHKLYLLIHNIDGPMLRSNKAQDTLSHLASIPNIHILASIDHINAPLRKLKKWFLYNFFINIYTYTVFNFIKFYIVKNNFCIVWDNVKQTRFNFYWQSCTTFLPYVIETSYENSFLVKKSGGLVLASLQNVFLSLTKNAKEIFILLANYQIKNQDSNYPGILKLLVTSF